MLLYLFLLLLLTGCLLFAGTFWFLRKGLLVVTVQGESMYPTLNSGDRLLVLRRALALRLRKGSIVVVGTLVEMNQSERMSEDQTCYVKRLVALGGETFTATMPTTLLQEEEACPGQRGTQQRSWLIPPEHVFVCGDNREHSRDSRAWGPLPLNRIIGIVLTKLPATSVAPPPSSSGDIIAHTPLPGGEPAPDFRAQTLDGETITLESYHQRALLFVFLANDTLSHQKFQPSSRWQKNVPSLIFPSFLSLMGRATWLRR